MRIAESAPLEFDKYFLNSSAAVAPAACAYHRMMIETAAAAAAAAKDGCLTNSHSRSGVAGVGTTLAVKTIGWIAEEVVEEIGKAAETE